MYLYERETWTDFQWDDSSILPLLSSVRFSQGELLGRVSELGFSLDEQLQLDATTDEIIASSQIEGIQLDASKVRSSVAKQLNIDQESLEADTHAVDGAVSVLLDATRTSFEPLTVEQLKGWHNALFPTGYSGLHKITVAEFRTGTMRVVSGAIGHEKIHYEAPEASRVPDMIDEYLLWLNEANVDPILKAAIAHLWFLTIHPFDDGNGRIARAITERLLVQSDGSPRRFYSVATYILKNRKAYYQAIEQAQKGTPNITAWILWFLEAVKGAIQESDKRITASLKRSAWWKALGDVSLNPRQKKMLKLLLGDFEGKLTTGKWAKICKVSNDTALRDITDLLDKGILVKNKDAGGRSTSYYLVPLP